MTLKQSATRMVYICLCVLTNGLILKTRIVEVPYGRNVGRELNHVNPSVPTARIYLFPKLGYPAETPTGHFELGISCYRT